VSGTPDLFVVCKNCRAEVSPYITECPYCGARLRKRAPKLDKGGVPKPPKRRRRPSAPALSRLRPGEMPGIRTDGRPYATILLVLVPIVFNIVWRAGVSEPVEWINSGEWYQYVAASFFYLTTSYELCTLAAVFLFGWLLERRHGFWAPLLVFTLGQAAGFAVAGLSLGGNAGALALLAAWAVRDLIAARRGEDIESDMLGVAFMAVLLLLLPAALYEPDPLAGIAGAVAGLIMGYGLAKLPQR
jgi:Rhomboid family